MPPTNPLAADTTLRVLLAAVPFLAAGFAGCSTELLVALRRSVRHAPARERLALATELERRFAATGALSHGVREQTSIQRAEVPSPTPVLEDSLS